MAKSFTGLKFGVASPASAHTRPPGPGICSLYIRVAFGFTESMLRKVAEPILCAPSSTAWPEVSGIGNLLRVGPHSPLQPGKL